MFAANIVTEARNLIGTRYIHQGRTDAGVDCAGLGVAVCTALELPIEDFLAYARTPNPQLMQSYLDRNLKRVPVALMQAGDVVWMRFRKLPQHLGILGDYPLGGYSLIHASDTTGRGMVIEHRLDEEWHRRIVAAWRFPGVD